MKVMVTAANAGWTPTSCQPPGLRRYGDDLMNPYTSRGLTCRPLCQFIDEETEGVSFSG